MAHTQDVLGQLPILQSYTHLLFCFPLPSSSSSSSSSSSASSAILSALECALHELFTRIPILAGQVIHDGASATSSGTFRVMPLPSRPDPIIRLVDHTPNPNIPSYDTLRHAHFPSHLLPGTIFSPPRPAFPMPYPADSQPIPVLDLQANLLHGGLLLTLAAQHNIIDASGIFQIASLLARLTRGESLPEAEIHEANRDRRHLIALYADHEPLQHDYSAYTPALIPHVLPNLQTLFPTFRWANFHFPPRSIQAIYTLAITPTPPPPNLKITPNDALTAFIWQRLSHIRLHSPTSSLSSLPQTTTTTTTTKLTRALDLRRTLSLSPAYLGHSIRTATLRLPFSEITSLPLHTVAALLRTQIISLRTLDSVRDYATFLAREKDKRKIAYAGGEFNPRTDFSCSSVAHVDLQRLALGWGKGQDEGVTRCEGVRRPEAGVLPGGCYLAEAGRWYASGDAARNGEEEKEEEKEKERGVEALMCLDGWEMEELMKDEEWIRWVEFIG